MATPMKPLSDDDANKEMKKMIAFIMQEAAEKCREIEIRADEEFNIEKAKIVRQETAAIEQTFARKFKQADVRRKIAQSTQINKARLQVLQAQDEILDEISEETQSRLVEFAKNTPVYTELLSKLLLQSMFRLMEDKLIVTCRQSDIPLIEKVSPSVIDAFREQSGKSVSLQIDQKHYLNGNGAGGVMVASANGKIKCDNTLETRLSQAFEGMLPTIRATLFGPSPNRKFFD